MKATLLISILICASIHHQGVLPHEVQPLVVTNTHGLLVPPHKASMVVSPTHHIGHGLVGLNLFEKGGHVLKLPVGEDPPKPC